MDSPPIRNDRILEALEACRGPSDDWSDPALAYLAAEMAVDPALKELCERVHKIDAKLATALCDVSVPQALADRLLQRLAAAPAVEGAPPEVAPQAAAAALSASGSWALAPLLPRRISRRWLLAAAVPLCAAAGLFLAVWLGVQRPSSYSQSRVLQEAVALFNEVVVEPLQVGAPPKDYPFSRDVLRVADIRWRPIHGGFLGRSGIAYELPEDRGSRAALYVVKCTVDGLPIAPPRRPAFTTANCFASAWQDGDLVYVLVVSGGEGAYRSYLNATQGPVT